MRVAMWVISGIAATTVSAICCADTLPERRPGLWEISAQGISMKQCIDKKTDQEMMKRAAEFNGAGESGCSKNEFKATASGYETNSVCLVSGSTVTSRGIFTGDFSKQYSGTITTSFSPPLFGQKESQATVAAKWLGECGSDLKPGDMVMPNGMKMNMEIAAQQAKQAAQMLNNPEFGKMVAGAQQGLSAEQNKALAEAMQKLGKEWEE
jgi:hypothetical protein